jgi:hypothetical protein
MSHIRRTTRVFEQDGTTDTATSPVRDGDARTAHDALLKRWNKMSAPVMQLRDENTLSRRITNNPTLGVYVETVTHHDVGEPMSQTCEECGADAGQACRWTCTGQPAANTVPRLADEK